MEYRLGLCPCLGRQKEGPRRKSCGTGSPSTDPFPCWASSQIESVLGHSPFSALLK